MRKFLVAVLVVVLPGCALYIPPEKHTFEKTRVVNKSYDKVWSNLVTWFADNNIPVRFMEKASGFVTTEYNLDVSDTAYCDCGGNDIGQRFDISVGNLNVVVEAIDANSTRVTVNTFYRCWAFNPMMQGSALPLFREKSSFARGESTGGLEAEIFKGVTR